MTSTVVLEKVTKTFGATTAVEDLSFECRSGRITGLLGRNGAGKSTAMRVLVGLVQPSSGRGLILGSTYAELPQAARRVGVAIDGIGAFPGLTGRQDLRAWARMLDVPRARVDHLLEEVGLAEAADRQVAGYSRGMRQRHSLATALLANPEVVVLDEPTEGLDPDGVRWLRGLLRGFADEGRTVLVSSHALAELEKVIDDVVIIQRTLRYAGPLGDLVEQGSDLEHRFFELVDAPAGVA